MVWALWCRPPQSKSISGESAQETWKYCPICGEPIEYNKAEHAQWSEQNCERCGSWLIMKKGDSPGPYFIASSDYVGAPICRVCMEEHCAQTNCFQCEIGQQPDCPYAWIKKSVLEHNDS